MNDLWLWIALPALAMGCITAFLAERRGYNPYLGFLVGVLFGCLGLFALFFFTQRKEKKGSVPNKIPIPTLQGPKDKFWYYVDLNQIQKGPISFEALRTAWKEGTVSPATLVWNEELLEWKPLQIFIE